MTPTGSGSSPWSHTFNVNPQFHTGGSDTDNFNREAVIDNGTGLNIITSESSFPWDPQEFGSMAIIPQLVGQVNYTYEKYLRLNTLISTEPTPALNITLTRDFIGNIPFQSRAGRYLPYSPQINYQYGL